MSSSTSSSESAHVKRFFLRYLLPLVVVIASFCIGVDILMREMVIFRTPIHGAAKLHRSINRESPEMPIIGSSRALGSYIPDSLSLRSYNYGINGIGFEVMDVFMRIEIARAQAKTPIILNFDYEMFNESVGDLNNYIPNIDHPDVRELMKRLGHYKRYWDIWGIRFFNSFDAYVKDYFNQRIQFTKLVTLGASIEKNQLPPAEFQKLIEQRLAEKQEWTPRVNLLDTLVRRIGQRPDRMWYIVVAPYHWSYYKSISPRGLALAHQALDSLDRLPNAIVVDVSGTDWPDSLFVNTSHVSLSGAKKFTKLVRKAIFGNNPGVSPEPLYWPPGHEPAWFPAYMDSLRRDSVLKAGPHPDSLNLAP